MRQPKQTELCPDAKVLNEIITCCNIYFRQLNGDKHQHITIDALRRKHRPNSLVFCRMLVSYYLYNCCHWRVSLIGYWMNRDHTTIVHSLAMFNDLMEIKDPVLVHIHNALSELFVTPEYAPADLFLMQFDQTVLDHNVKAQIIGARYGKLQRRVRLAEKKAERYFEEAKQLKKLLEVA